ncbi:MAG TPA: hypothetical protein VFM35_01385 [Candidatus Binatia bacterium]|nr:hypothetical protein [Candidatus Binatia bacterium]
MKNFSRIGFFLAVLALSRAEPALPQSFDDTVYQQWVEYQDGEISVIFDQAPVEIALDAIRASAGFEIILPPAMESKLLNLRLIRLPLEPAVRSLLASIGYKNFALMYDEEGRPSRVFVLEARSEERANLASQSPESTTTPLTAAEKDKLQEELQRWSELKQEDRARIEARLRKLPRSEEREQLIQEYGRQILGIK